jgi:protein arginine N-methyltransferase 1
MADSIDDHHRFLDDPHRVGAFARAIAETIRPGDVVADLASGTGILALLACRAGASRVYAIEKTGMSAFANRIAADNGFAGRVIAVRGDSHRVELPERVDAIVSDLVGRIGFIKGGADDLNDARARWLKPGGRMLPERTTTWIAPVEQPSVYAHVDFWSRPVAGFDLSALREPAANTHYPHAFEPRDLLSQGVAVAQCDHRAPGSAVVRGSASFAVERTGTLHGIAAWGVAQLSSTVTYTNAPGAADRIRRPNGFLPVDRPTEVRPGDIVDAELIIRPSDFLIVWTIRSRRGSETLAECRQSTLNGMWLTREDLAAAVSADPALA